VFRTAGSVAQSCHIPQGGNGNGCSWMSANARFLPPWNFQTRAKKGQKHQCARGLGLKTKVLCWNTRGTCDIVMPVQCIFMTDIALHTAYPHNSL